MGIHLHGDDHRSEATKRKLILVSILCLIFTIMEAIGGYKSGSIAILSDAGHLLTDLISFVISFIAVQMADRPPDKNHPHGYKRAQVLGAFFSIILIWFLTLLLLHDAVNRLFSPDPINVPLMLILALSGMFFNGILAFVLHPPSHSSCSHAHNHGAHDHEEDYLHTHDHAASDGHQYTDINISAAYIHVIGDLIQSAGVLLAAVLLHYFPKYTFIDPFCTFLFSCLVFATTLPVFKSSLVILMEAAPAHLCDSEIRGYIQKFDPSIVEITHLQMWSLSTDHHVLAAHIAVYPATGQLPQGLSSDLEQAIRKKFGFAFVTIQTDLNLA